MGLYLTFVTFNEDELIFFIIFLKNIYLNVILWGYFRGIYNFIINNLFKITLNFHCFLFLSHLTTYFRHFFPKHT